MPVMLLGDQFLFITAMIILLTRAGRQAQRRVARPLAMPVLVVPTEGKNSRPLGASKTIEVIKPRGRGSFPGLENSGSYRFRCFVVVS